MILGQVQLIMGLFIEKKSPRSLPHKNYFNMEKMSSHICPVNALPLLNGTGLPVSITSSGEGSPW